MTINKLLFIIILSFSAISLDCVEAGEVNDIRQLWIDCKMQKEVSFEIFNTAILGYRKTENIKKKNILTIIDFSKPSSQKRFYVIDPEKKQLLFKTYVAHGKNSGENFTDSFSNLSNSLQSSLGFFLTAETYIGENGFSMKLDGLEKGINDNARDREIVIHGAGYVSEEYIRKYGRLGRSWGCPALPAEVSKEIIDVISNGSCLFIYAVDSYYKENSNFVSK
jgi:hypothetical protein